MTREERRIRPVNDHPGRPVASAGGPHDARSAVLAAATEAVA